MQEERGFVQAKMAEMREQIMKMSARFAEQFTISTPPTGNGSSSSTAGVSASAPGLQPTIRTTTSHGGALTITEPLPIPQPQPQPQGQPQEEQMHSTREQQSDQQNGADPRLIESDKRFQALADKLTKEIQELKASVTSKVPVLNLKDLAKESLGEALALPWQEKRMNLQH